MSPMRRMAHGSEHPKVRFRATRNPVQVSEVPGGGGRLAPSSKVPATRCLTARGPEPGETVAVAFSKGGRCSSGVLKMAGS
jgi:hypothetical protein